MSELKLNLLDLKDGKIRILHLTWLAFFLTFVVWLGLGPMMPFIKEALQLTDQQAKVLLILNVAMTIPARIIVGMLVDKHGPRIMFSAILILGGAISIAFAWADSYQTLALLRFLSGFIGAGFVVGIRMTSEWFPARQTGIAQGIYAGWGNFGSAGAAMTLPFIAANFGGDDGWRWAFTIASLVAIAYGVLYYFSVSNTPKGSTYFKPKKSGAMEVTSRGDLVLYILMNVPLYLALALLTWKLSPARMGLIDWATADIIYLVLGALYLVQSWKVWHVNTHILGKPRPRAAPLQVQAGSRPGLGLPGDLRHRAGGGLDAGHVLRGLVRPAQGDRRPARRRLSLPQPVRPPRWRLAE